MNIYSFLLELIKILVPISIGSVTLALTFADKLKLNFLDRNTRISLYGLWISFILSLISYIGFGISIFNDIGKSTADGNTLFSSTSKSFLMLSLLTFICIIIFLTWIGNIVIHNHSSKDSSLQVGDEIVPQKN